eukprot:scaffold19262_cov117-Isochrysis_galbana.AAC.2
MASRYTPWATSMRPPAGTTGWRPPSERERCRGGWRPPPFCHCAVVGGLPKLIELLGVAFSQVTS